MPKSRIVSISLPPDKLRAIDRAARSDGRSRSQFLQRAADQAIKENMRSLADHKKGTRPDHRLIHNGETKRDTLARGITTLKEGTVPNHLLPYPNRAKEI